MFACMTSLPAIFIIIISFVLLPLYMNTRLVFEFYAWCQHELYFHTVYCLLGICSPLKFPCPKMKMTATVFSTLLCGCGHCSCAVQYILRTGMKCTFGLHRHCMLHVCQLKVVEENIANPLFLNFLFSSWSQEGRVASPSRKPNWHAPVLCPFLYKILYYTGIHCTNFFLKIVQGAKSFDCMALAKSQHVLLIYNYYNNNNNSTS